MDAVLAGALASTAEGQSFTAAIASGADTQETWTEFVSVLSVQRKAELQAAAGNDATAQGALNALDTFMTSTSKLASGEVPEFVDTEQAQQDLKSGQQPTVNPDYEKAVSDRMSSHITLSECMPTWPVVF